MAEQKSFRSAFNGFNREDVVHYIEYLTAKHKAQVNQLPSEAAFLKSKLAEAQDAPPAESIDTEELEQMRQQNISLLEQVELLNREKSELEGQRDAALAENARLQSEIAEALAAAAQAEVGRSDALQQLKVQSSNANAELEAYRRAERTERRAQERAQQLYQQANGALADATVKVDEAAGQISELTEQCISQLQQLQAAVAGSKAALKDAAETMYTIRPEGDEE